MSHLAIVDSQFSIITIINLLSADLPAQADITKCVGELQYLETLSGLK